MKHTLYILIARVALSCSKDSIDGSQLQTLQEYMENHLFLANRAITVDGIGYGTRKILLQFDFDNECIVKQIAEYETEVFQCYTDGQNECELRIEFTFESLKCCFPLLSLTWFLLAFVFALAATCLVNSRLMHYD